MEGFERSETTAEDEICFTWIVGISRLDVVLCQFDVEKER